MENTQDQVNTNPANSTQQLNQFVTQLEAEVGYSGRTLYQVLSEYLILKSRHPELCWDVEGLEIPQSEQLSLVQFQNNRELLGKLQDVKEQVSQGLDNLEQHPWRWFGHVDQHSEDHKKDFDALMRTLRITSIQLNKFWVELQSCPLFFNSLNHSSVSQVEEILQWIKSSPNWSELNSHGRLIPALVQPNSRKTLMDFRRDVKSARILKDRLKSQLENYSNQESTQAQLKTVSDLVQKHTLGECLKADIEKRGKDGARRLSQVQRIVEFIFQVHAETVFPKATGFQEARHTLKALRLIRDMPGEIQLWRRPQILAVGQALRLQTWDERARPLREMRKRLEGHFILRKMSDAETLRDLAEALTAGGPLRRFKSEHKNAERNYLELLLDPVGPGGGAKETPLEKSQRLLEWAGFLEQMKAFEENSDLINVFGPLFQGVDTQFDAALRANTWATQLRQDLQSNQFGKTAVDYIVSASDEQIQKLIGLAQKSDLGELEKILIELAPQIELPMAVWVQDEEAKLAELRDLVTYLSQLGLRSDLKMDTLQDIQQMNEELRFLEAQMDLNSDLKIWLKNIYFGSDTDITLIERGLSYVRFVEEAPIPETMKISFLSLHGPQRFNESKGLISSVLSSLTPLKEHLHKLETLTFGQVLPLENGPILKLMTHIQEALKQPALLESWVEYLKLDKEVRARGLAVVLDFFESKPKGSFRLDLAYEMALDASVLKKKMSGSLFQDISIESITMNQ